MSAQTAAVGSTAQSTVRHTRSHPRLAYEVHGAGEQKVVLIQGLGMGRQGWEPQIPALSAHHQVAVFDNRGIGDSERVRDWFTVGELASDVLRLADELGWERFHLMGVSFGGMIAQEVCLAAPPRIRSLCIIASHAGGLRAPVPTLRGWWPFVASTFRKGEARRRAVAQLIFSPLFLQTAHPRAVERRLAMTAQQPSDILLRQLAAVVRHRTAKRLPSLKIPTLIVRPGMDRICRPSNSDELHRLISQSRLARFDQSGHAVIFEQAEALNPLLLEHIAAHAASG